MRRRELLAAATAGAGGAVAGCLDGDDGAEDAADDATAELHSIELGNHRHDEPYEFALSVEREGEVVFEATRRLGPAGSGTETATFQRPIEEAGPFLVSVEAGDQAVTTETGSLGPADAACLGLEYYLGASTLHQEHRGSDRCE